MKAYYPLFLLLIGCASIKVDYTAEPEAEFDRYQTFYCLECTDDFDPNNPQYDNIENREFIRQTIHSELISRGYIFEKENPDLLVDFHIVIEEKSAMVSDVYPMAWKTHDFALYPTQYQFGTLIIHMVDNNTNQLVWQGTGAKILENPKRSKATIEKSIAKIFKQFAYRGLSEGPNPAL